MYKASRFSTGILYKLGKIHKEFHNGILPFHLILTAIGARKAKFLLQFLTPSAANEYTVIDSFHFVEDIRRKEFNLLTILNV